MRCGYSLPFWDDCMGLVHISNLSDERLEPYRSLKKNNATRWSNQFIAEGDKVVERLIASPYPIESILIAERFLEDWKGKIPEHVTMLVVADSMVEEIVGFNFHRGTLACGNRKCATNWSEILPVEKSKPVRIVVCPDVQNPENLGMILRLCAGLDVTAVAVGPLACDPFSRRVLRVSMGYSLHIPLMIMTNPVADLSELKNDWDCELVATVIDQNAETFSEARSSQRQAILFGSEGHGLPAELIEICDRKWTIPMSRNVDSLNVAMTAAIVLHRVTREQR
jgi:tRNA G18 (ribose-2'-O)-methylase SpoU